MIQDIEPHRFQNQYRQGVVPTAQASVICFHQLKVLVKAEKQIQFPTVEEVGMKSAFVYLFTVDDDMYFLLRDDIEGIEGYEWLDIKELRKKCVEPKYQIFALYTAKHLYDWYLDNSFCGRCGHVMEHSQKERAMTCPDCGYTSYPRIMPAVIVGVINNDSLLLTRYREGYQHNALIAGFTEIGETLEETVRREVMEEAGVNIKNIRYYKSQPWGVANDILMGFYCDVDGDTTIHMDEQELRFAQWVQREDIVLQPDNYSLTNEMMKQFKVGKQ